MNDLAQILEAFRFADQLSQVAFQTNTVSGTIRLVRFGPTSPGFVSGRERSK
jgi:hypothetical protein